MSDSHLLFGLLFSFVGFARSGGCFLSGWRRARLWRVQKLGCYFDYLRSFSQIDFADAAVVLGFAALFLSILNDFLEQLLGRLVAYGGLHLRQSGEAVQLGAVLAVRLLRGRPTARLALRLNRFSIAAI